MTLKKLFVPFLFFVTVTTLFAASKKVQAPAWMTDFRAVYTDEEYIAQMADAPTQMEAQVQALNFIAGLFETHVKSHGVSTTMVTVESVNGNKEMKSSRNASETINVKTNAELFGLHYEFYYAEKQKRWYCAAYINRKETWNHFYTKMEAEKQYFKGLYEQAIANESVQPMLAIRDYRLAYPHIVTVAHYMDYAGMIMPSKATIYDEDIASANTIPGKVTRLKRNCTFALNVTGDREDRVRALIKDIYSNEGYTVRDDSNRAKYLIYATIDFNIRVDGVSDGDKVYSTVPTIDIEIDQNDTILFTYTKSLPKAKYYSEEACEKKAMNSIVEVLQESLLKEFYENL